MDELERIHKLHYEEYLNFIKEQLEIGECVCEKTFKKLTKYSERGENALEIKEFINGKYSSEKKIQPFDSVFIFMELVLTESSIVTSVIYTCEQEIENYSKSHRFFKFTDSPMQPSLYKSDFFIKVFEYKPSKI